MQRLGVGVIGTGNVSSEHIKAYLRNPHVELAALYDSVRENAEAKVSSLGLNCTVYSSLDEFLRDERVKLVSITTPNRYHAELAIAAAGAGKHILVEKPAAMNLGELRAIETAVRKSGVRSLVGFVLRRNPLVKMLHRLVRGGVIGETFYAEMDYWHETPRATADHWMSQRDFAGSVFLMGGCHAVDTARFLVGSEITQVYAYSTKGKGRRYYTYDPTVVAAVKFANGAVGKISASMECRMPYAFNIVMMGDQGTIRDNRLWSNQYAEQTDWITLPTITPNSGSVTHHPFQPEIDEFVEGILTGAPVLPDIPDAVKTHEVVLAVDRSAETGQPVSLPLEP